MKNIERRKNAILLQHRVHREYYAQSTEFYARNLPIWVRNNVLPHLHNCAYSGEKEDFCDSPPILISKICHSIGSATHPGKCQNPNCTWCTRKQIRDDVASFMDINKYGNPEIWGYYSGFDYVILSQLFGTLDDYPEGWPMYIRDIQQVIDEQNIQSLPHQPSNQHNALADARWIKEVCEHVYSIKHV